MERSLYENISFQHQDEDFADGLAKILQANISGYMAMQRIKERESDNRNEAVQELLGMMKVLKEDQKTQQSQIQGLREDIQNSFRSVQEQNECRWEEWMKDAGRIQEDASNILSQIQAVKTNMDVQAREQEKTREAQKLLEDDISRLEQEITEYREISGEWDLYHRFRNWQPSLQIPILFPRSDGFIDFIATCSYKDTVETLFRSAGGSIWELQETDIKMFDDMIDLCVDLQNRIYGKEIYTRMHVEIGEGYSLQYHQSHSDDPAVGRIAKVLLRGVNVNGGSRIFKSFVRVSE